MSNKKILTAVLIFGMAIALSGCGKPVVENDKPSQKEIQPEELLPKPTGKIDDVVSAAISDAEKEITDMAQEETDAVTSLDDSQETGDFGQSYDENEF